MISPFPFLDDRVGIGSPEKKLGFAIVFAEVPVDPSLQVDDLRHIEPAVRRVVLDAVGLALPIAVDQIRGDEICKGDGDQRLNDGRVLNAASATSIFDASL